MDGDERDRVRLPRLERTKPIRSAERLGGAGAAAPDARRADDLVGASVELGYRVVDAYVRRGQEAARRLSAADVPPRDLVNDARELATRLVRSAAEFAAAFGDVFDLTARQGGTGAADTEPPAADAPPTEARPPSPDPVALRIRLEGGGVLEATLELHGAPTSHALVVPPLRTTAPDGPLLGGVTVVGSGRVRTIALVVPADQPAATYAGPVIDDEVNCPVGWLTVTVGDPSRRGA